MHGTGPIAFAATPPSEARMCPPSLGPTVQGLPCRSQARATASASPKPLRVKPLDSGAIAGWAA